MFYLNRRNSMKRVLTITFFLVSITAVLYADDPNTPYHPQVSIMTSKGEIVVELRPEKAPKTVENFLEYVNSGFYENTIFHRVIKGFMIQGGGLTADLIKRRPGIQSGMRLTTAFQTGSILLQWHVQMILILQHHSFYQHSQ